VFPRNDALSAYFWNGNISGGCLSKNFLGSNHTFNPPSELYEQQACNEQKTGSVPCWRNDPSLGLPWVMVELCYLGVQCLDFDMKRDWNYSWGYLSKRNRYFWCHFLYKSPWRNRVGQMNRHLAVICKYRHTYRFPPYLVHLCSALPLNHRHV
jgi:hypothetical protein